MLGADVGPGSGGLLQTLAICTFFTQYQPDERVDFPYAFFVKANSGQPTAQIQATCNRNSLSACRIASHVTQIWLHPNKLTDIDSRTKHAKPHAKYLRSSNGSWSESVVFWTNLPTTVATIVLSSRLGATLVGVALLVAVGALNARPVGRLGTVTTSVAELVAVTALNLGHVARLRALLRDMALLIAVAAGDDALLVALLSTMALFTAVAADVRLAVRAVA